MTTYKWLRLAGAAPGPADREGERVVILLLLLLALVLAGLLVLRARRRRDREERRLVRDYIEAHPFPGDLLSIADLLTEHGDVTIAEVRRISEAYRRGWQDHREQIRRNHTRRAYR